MRHGSSWCLQMEISRSRDRQDSAVVDPFSPSEVYLQWRQEDGCDTAGYMQEHYDVISNVMKSMFVEVGWKNDFIEKNTLVLHSSGRMSEEVGKHGMVEVLRRFCGYDEVPR